jgi:glycosyltransferase involved in cell wall biosynthesis
MSTSIVVVPCYNEASRLDVNAFAGFAAHTDIRLLFVDDGSTDKTLELLRSLENAHPTQIGVLSLRTNVGKAEAVRVGLLEACRSRPTYVGFWDADLATPLEDIKVFEQLLDSRPDIEMVFGSRVNLLGRSVHRKLARHYIGRVFATAAAFVLGIGIYDTQCGAKMFRVSDRFVQQLQEPFVGGWIFDVEMIAREISSRRGTNLPHTRTIIYEYPLTVWRDVAGSKIKPRDWLAVSANLGRIYFKYMWLRRG